ncbi:IS3 family transposase [Kitasatospora sp. NPDC057500]|uniref:IS3 family transposase n=1 Tax=Kitasatospora sp. NPDC057500 TaxID=3346151 RepID=UPI0036920D37
MGRQADLPRPWYHPLLLPCLARRRAEGLLAAEITVIHLTSRGAYGVPRVHAELRRQSRAVNRKKVERIMRERGIAGVTRRRRRGLTRRAHKPVFAPDLIGRDFTAPRPGVRLVGDMTFLPTEEGRPPPPRRTTGGRAADGGRPRRSTAWPHHAHRSRQRIHVS